MARVRRRDTEPERVVRRLLHRNGFRFRVCTKALPGSPDVALPKWQTAIFVHGCFWHGHDCHLYKLPATRPDWWATKVAANVQRDQRKRNELIACAWKVVTVWQCAIQGKARLKPLALLRQLNRAVRGRRLSTEIRGRKSPATNPYRISSERAGSSTREMRMKSARVRAWIVKSLGGDRRSQRPRNQ